MNTQPTQPSPAQDPAATDSASSTSKPPIATALLQPLVPTPVQQMLANNTNRLDQPFSTTESVILLFADMAGFSTLGADFARTFKRGAEELRTIMNVLFDAVVNDISSHGGATLYFAGDAVFAVWRLPADNIDAAAAETATRRALIQAVEAGLAIQTTCKQLSATELLHGGDRSLSMRVAIGQGDLSLVHAIDNGLAEHAKYVIHGGSVMDGLGALGKHATREGVFVEQACQAAIASDCEGNSITDGLIVTQVQSASLSTAGSATEDNSAAASYGFAQSNTVDLAPYIAAETRAQLATVQSEWLSEYRETQVLFTSFKPATDTPPGVTPNSVNAGKTRQIVRIASSCVRSAGGLVVQLINDDKGLILLAAWGLAMNSHENNAERAIASARDIVAGCSEIGIVANTGVTSGYVFAGLLGNKHRLNFTLVGDAVNRAASMMQQSDGTVLCDEATRQAANKRYSFSKHSDIQLKGHSQKSPLFSPGIETLRDLDHTGEMVGRLQERQIINDMLASSVTEFNVLHIEGVAGLGKSRLANFFINQLQTDHIPHVKITADSMRRTVGYAPFKTLVLQLLPAQAEPAESEQTSLQTSPQTALESTLQTLLADEYHDWIPLLSPVLPVAIPENATTLALSGGGRSENTRAIMVSLLQRILPDKLRFLVVEDAHWCDSASWQIVEALERALPNITIVVVSRPLDLMQLPTEVRRLFVDARKITLEPLNLDETKQLVCNEINLTSVTADVAQLVFNQAEGHPLYTKAFSRSLVNRDILATEAGYGRLNLGDVALQNIEFPDGLAGVFAEQLAGMAPEVQLSLKVASIQGRLFDLQILRSVHPDNRSIEELTKHIESGIQTGLIDAANDDSGNYRFHHAIIVDTIYKLLVSEQRLALHDATAANLLRSTENSSDIENESAAVLLAYHYEQAGNDEQALVYLQRAATSAHNSYRNVETVDFLTRALNLSTRSSAANDAMTGATGRKLADEHQLGVWKFQTAEALRALGLYQRAEEFLVDCATSTDRKPPATGMRATGRLLSEFARFKLKPHREPIAEPARSELLTAAAANATLSEIHYELNKVPFALAEILRGANLARAAGGDSATISKLYIGMALISTSLPWALDGDELQRDALAIAERVGDDPMSSYVYMVSGVYDTGKGRWQTAHDQLQRSIEVGERCGERKNVETSMSCFGNLERLHGNFHEAKRWSKLTLDLSQDRGIAHQIIWSHNGMARDMLCLNQFDELEQTIEALGELLNDPSKKRDANDNNNLVYLYSRGISALVAKDFTTTREYLDQIVAIIAQIPRPQVFMIQNVGFYADIVWNLWTHDCDRPGLLAHMPAILKSAAKVSKQYHTGKPLQELALGDNAFYKGDTARAIDWWQTSIDSARERGMPFNEAQAAHRIQQLIDTAQAEQSHAREWQAALTTLNIERPLSWQI